LRCHLIGCREKYEQKKTIIVLERASNSSCIYVPLQFLHLLARTKKKPEEKAPRGLYYTRAEDIEIDDVDPGAKKP